MFAEILRLRVTGLIVRTPSDAKGLSLPGGWHVKANEAVILSMRTELMDPDVWNTGDAANPHPVDRFWAERFLVYPGSPRSGPLRKPKRRPNAAANGSPYFSLEGCTWNWIPFGTGRSQCAGRHFAKSEILLTTAIFLSAFDIELLTDKLPSEDQASSGLGTSYPKGKVPFRIRRRKLEAP
jgi:cytochrome P450